MDFEMMISGLPDVLISILYSFSLPFNQTTFLLDWSKFESIWRRQYKCDRKIEIVLGRVEKVVGNEKKLVTSMGILLVDR